MSCSHDSPGRCFWLRQAAFLHTGTQSSSLVPSRTLPSLSVSYGLFCHVPGAERRGHAGDTSCWKKTWAWIQSWLSFPSEPKQRTTLTAYKAGKHSRAKCWEEEEKGFMWWPTNNRNMRVCMVFITHLRTHVILPFQQMELLRKPFNTSKGT